VDKIELEKLLAGWSQLNSGLMGLSESDVVKLLALEQAGKARLRFLLRIHNRLSKLRGIRERNEIAGTARG
jgi:hypothetical protein